MKCNHTLTNTPGLLKSACVSIPFDYCASVGEIVLVEYLMRHTLISLPGYLSFILTNSRHKVSMLCKPLCMVLLTLQNPIYHCLCDVQTAHHPMQDSHFSHCRELVGITRTVIISIQFSVQYPCVSNSVLPQSHNLCKYLALLFQYPELLGYYCMVCCCGIEVCPTQFGCSNKHRGIWQILEFELYYCALIIAHLCIHAENIQRICKEFFEPPLQMMNLACQRAK